jgi:hypothetical protein
VRGFFAHFAYFYVTEFSCLAQSRAAAPRYRGRTDRDRRSPATAGKPLAYQRLEIGRVIGPLTATSALTAAFFGRSRPKFLPLRPVPASARWPWRSELGRVSRRAYLGHPNCPDPGGFCFADAAITDCRERCQLDPAARSAQKTEAPDAPAELRGRGLSRALLRSGPERPAQGACQGGRKGVKTLGSRRSGVCGVSL